MSGSVTGSLQIRWDPKNLEIRTKSVEKTLEPLVTQVNYLEVSVEDNKILKKSYVFQMLCLNGLLSVICMVAKFVKHSK